MISIINKRKLNTFSDSSDENDLECKAKNQNSKNESVCVEFSKVSTSTISSFHEYKNVQQSTENCAPAIKTKSRIPLKIGKIKNIKLYSLLYEI